MGMWLNDEPHEAGAKHMYARRTQDVGWEVFMDITAAKALRAAARWCDKNPGLTPLELQLRVPLSSLDDDEEDVETSMYDDAYEVWIRVEAPHGLIEFVDAPA